ncbi:MAG: hypothetical protein ACLFRI_04315 [Candidatus Izemoplasmataceae bacterium]
MRKESTKDRIIEAASRDVPDVLSRIKEDHRFKVPEHKPFFKRIELVKLMPYTAALIVILALIFTLNFNNPQPIEASSTVYIEINPALEIDLNEEDEIIAIRVKNQKAQEILDNLIDYEGQKVDVFIERLIQKAIERGYLSSENPFVMYDISGKNTVITARIEAMLNERVPEIAQRNLPGLAFVHGNAKNLTQEEINNAREHNINVMKYRLIQTILENNDTYTFDELKALSIGELRALLSNDERLPVIPNTPRRRNNSNVPRN